MSSPEDLKGRYTDELKDLQSGNDQMMRVLKKVTRKASDPQLKEMLASSQAGIQTHTDISKELIAGQGGKTTKEHCKGIGGLSPKPRSISLRRIQRRDRCSTRSSSPSTSA